MKYRADPKRRTSIFFIFLLVFMVGLILSTRQFSFKNSPVSGTVVREPKEIRALFMKRMKEIGPEKTYNEVKQTYMKEHFSFQHRVAHIFGEVLYAQSGIQGITVCDDSFAFGCYHSFFGRALLDGGMEVVKKLDDVCVEHFGQMGLGCSHGIGHGLGEYLGPTKLSEQLAACAELTWQGAFFGCQSGVFMEYNFPTNIAEDSVASGVRPFDQADPYKPCPTVAARFRRACYLELPGWWIGQLERDYQRVGAMCRNLNDPGEQEACFRGVGFAVAPITSYNTQETMDICEKMPAIVDQMLCKAGASWSFFADPKNRNYADVLCQDSTGHIDSACMKKADLLSEK